jgi:hypothetical protein
MLVRRNWNDKGVWNGEPIPVHPGQVQGLAPDLGDISVLDVRQEKKWSDQRIAPGVRSCLESPPDAK